jgi:hypothetical protein
MDQGVAIFGGDLQAVGRWAFQEDWLFFAPMPALASASKRLSHTHPCNILVSTPSEVKARVGELLVLSRMLDDAIHASG